MRRLPLAACLLGLAVAACSKPAGSGPLADAASQTAAAKPLRATPAAGDAAAALPLLAYSYSATVSAPGDATPRLLAHHEAACAQAGPAVCQVVGSDRSSTGDEAHAQLTLRAQPAWLQAFRARLAEDVRPFGGDVVATGTTSEDLTRQIVDTDAQLRAKTALADRLQQLLTTRQGSLADLVATEKALSDTQGEIDAARSELAAMQARVATSELVLIYTSRQAFSGMWAPVGAAIHSSGGVFAGAVGAIILLAASLMPFAILAGLGVIAWRLWRGRRGAAPPPPQ